MSLKGKKITDFHYKPFFYLNDILVFSCNKLRRTIPAMWERGLISSGGDENLLFWGTEESKRLMTFYLEEIIQVEFWEFCFNDTSVDDWKSCDFRVSWNHGDFTADTPLWGQMPSFQWSSPALSSFRHANDLLIQKTILHRYQKQTSQKQASKVTRSNGNSCKDD